MSSLGFFRVQVNCAGSGGVLLVRFGAQSGSLLCVKPQRLEARGELFLGIFQSIFSMHWQLSSYYFPQLLEFLVSGCGL